MKDQSWQIPIGKPDTCVFKKISKNCLKCTKVLDGGKNNAIVKIYSILASTYVLHMGGQGTEN